MLLQFTVENFRSFKEKTVFSLEASTDKDLEDNFTFEGKDKVLRTAAIYGANASGKSNFFSALSAAIIIVRTSAVRQPGELLPVTPFVFSKETKSKPSSFEFVFIAEGTKYVYGFSCDATKIHTEYLYAYYTKKATTVFERDITDDPEYRFTMPAVKKSLKPIIERNTANKLFLTTAAIWNSSELAVPFRWFQNNIDSFETRYDYEELIHFIGPMYENDEDGSLREFTKKILHQTDINIDDYDLSSREISAEQLPPGIPDAIRSMIPAGTVEYTITTSHHVDDEESVRLSLRDESEGTRSLFMLSPVLKHAFENGKVICADEFDSHLHPMLLMFLVGLFHNPEVNTHNAQLVMSLHTTELLSLKVMRRDQIYFIEKNPDTFASELYSLDEFSPRTREDVRKAYLLGRYGSVPHLGSGDGL